MRWRDNKFGNAPQRCHQGAMHHSKLESQQCNVLHALQESGIVADLQAHPQPRYRLEVNGKHICDVIPDFEFTWTETGEKRTIDVKGIFTDVARIKYKLFEALFGREVEIVRKPWTFR